MSKSVKLHLVGYLAVLVVILAYPIWTIWKFESRRIPSQEFLFQCAVYDPYDPMRGRYVQLSFDQEQITLSQALPTDYRSHDFCYAVLETDRTDGYAKIVRLVISQDEVLSGEWALKLSTDEIWTRAPDTLDKDDSNQHPYSLRLPFKRYFVNERIAPKADKLLNALVVSSSGKEPEARVALKVRVLATGDYAVEDLLVDGRPLREVVAEMKE